MQRSLPACFATIAAGTRSKQTARAGSSKEQEVHQATGLIVERWDERRYGPLSIASMENKLEREGFVTRVYVFPPGTAFPDHTHEQEKKDAIISGRFLMRMGGSEVVLGPGDQIDVPAGVVHSAAVVGDEQVVFVDATRGGWF